MNKRHYRTASEHEIDLLKTENDRLTIALLEIDVCFSHVLNSSIILAFYP